MLLASMYGHRLALEFALRESGKEGGDKQKGGKDDSRNPKDVC